MTRPIPGPSPAALAKALARQQADAARFPEGAVVRIITSTWVLQPAEPVTVTRDDAYGRSDSMTLVTEALRTGELWVIAKAEPGQVTLVNPRDGRRMVAGQDTLKQCAEVVT